MGSGGANDAIVVNFSVSSHGENLQTSWDATLLEPKNAGWLSAGGTLLNADGEYVQFDFVSLSVDLNGGTGNGSGTFDGFSAISFGGFGAGEVATANGLTIQSDIDGKVLDLSGGGLDSNLQAIHDSALGASGSWRPENWSFQVTAVIPEPGTLSLVALAGGGLFFIRRRMTR